MKNLSEMKIVFVLSSLNFGGTEKQAILLAKEYNNKFKNVSIYCTSKQMTLYKECFERSNIEVDYCKGTLGFYPLKLYLISKYLKRKKPDIIIPFLLSTTINVYLTNRLFKLFNRKFFIIPFMRNSMDFRYCRMNKFKKWLMVVLGKIILKNSTAVFINSLKAKQYLVNFWGLNPSSIYYMRNGIVAPERNVKLRDNDNITIGTIGKISSCKNNKMLSMVIEEILKYHNQLRIILIGYNETIYDSITFRNLFQFKNRISIINNVIDIYAVLSKLDIFVFTSQDEGMPNAILEAMVLGIPVVTTDVGGISEVIANETNGYLVLSDDVRSMVKYIKLLIENDSLRGKIGFKARDTVIHGFEIKKVVTEHFTIIEDIFNQRNIVC